MREISYAHEYTCPDCGFSPCRCAERAARERDRDRAGRDWGFLEDVQSRRLADIFNLAEQAQEQHDERTDQ